MAAEGSDERPWLQSVMLDGVTDMGEVVGKGSFGTVFKVKRWGTVCAAKRLQDLDVPLRMGGVEPGDQSLLRKFEAECLLLSSLRHPNIVQFLGVYAEGTRASPVLVMEYLPTSLAACLETRPRLLVPLHLQISILGNVALGLAYLHGHAPPVIHRDLTANNVLLTSNMTAKIGDLGVARMIELKPSRSLHLTQAPGTTAYMPPEALALQPNYNTKIDSFSFGVLVVHLSSHEWPIPGEAVKVSGSNLIPVSEAARRQRYLDLMGKENCLLPLVLQCLQNDANLRPEIASVSDTLGALQTRHPVPRASYLDMLQVLENNHLQLEAKGVQLAANKEQLEMVSQELSVRGSELRLLREKVTRMEKSMADAIKAMLLKTDVVTDSAKHSPLKASALRPTQSIFVWKRDVVMPQGMYGARAIMLDDKLYIGGGESKDLGRDCIVFEYDINGLVRKWTALPAAPVATFALAAVNKSLTLVGGLDVGKKTSTNLLTVWDRGMQRWVSPFPPMPTPRQDATVASHHLWLLVAGGVHLKRPVHNVELFDSATFQWQSMHPLPRPCAGMTSCIVRDTWFLLGGSNFGDGESGPRQCVYALSLEGTFAAHKWTVLPDTPLYFSAAVPFGEFLMAVGGSDAVSSRSKSPALFMFSPALERWLYVGDMPTARSRATCLVLSQGRLLILGGQENKAKYGCTVEMLSC